MKTIKYLVPIITLFFLAVVLSPNDTEAKVDWKSLLHVNLESQPLDVTTSIDGKLIYALTPGEIIVFSVKDKNILDRIPVGTSYNRITFSPDETLILTGNNPSSLEIIRVDRVYDIDISNRPFKGSSDARVAIVIFDDYQ